MAETLVQNDTAGGNPIYLKPYSSQYYGFWRDETPLGRISAGQLQDPYTFDSEWVAKENEWATELGRPIVALYDGDRHRWGQLKK